MANFILQENPVIVPMPDDKLIEEHFGRISLNGSGFSIAHMVAPPFWSEPHQRPDFDEVTIVVRGRKKVELDGNSIILEPGKTLLVKKGARVRYSNPFNDECEYWSVCIPAFSPEAVHRES